jgi:diacylglycerol kinase family enzyme
VTRRPILVLANPAAGGKLGSGPRLAEDAALLEPAALERALRERGLEVHLHELSEEDDVAALSASAAAAGRDVVGAGGDGTVASAAGALLDSDATLGILAAGSFNNIAHGFGIPTELEPALEVIGRGEAARVDAAEVHHPDVEPATFFEAAGVGVEAAGFAIVDVRERRGWWFGARIAWRALRHRSSVVRLSIDGRTAIVRTPAVVVCNGPYHGLGFAVAPDADPADGLLDAALFRRMGATRLVLHLLRVARGRRIREPRVQVRRGREIRIESVGPAVLVHADGRLTGGTPVTFRVREGALRVFR